MGNQITPSHSDFCSLNRRPFWEDLTFPKIYSFQWVLRRHTSDCYQDFPYFPSTVVPFLHVRAVQVERRPTAGFSSLIIRKTEDALFLFQGHARSYPQAKIWNLFYLIFKIMQGNDLSHIFLIDSNCIVSFIFYHEKYHFLPEHSHVLITQFTIWVKLW